MAHHITTDKTALLSKVIDACVYGMIVIDSDWKIQLWNDWMEQTSEIPSSEAVGKLFLNLFPSLKEGRITASIKAALHSGASAVISHAFTRTHLPLHRPGHKDKALEQMIYVKPISISDTQRYCLIQVSDISAAVKRERQLKEMAHSADIARKAAEDYSDLKSGFVATVSHELRTPLTAIRGSLSLLSNEAVGSVDQEAKSLIDIANNNTTRLLMLVNDILDIEKIESNRMKFNFDDIDVPTFLQQSIASISDYGRQQEVSFKLVHCPKVIIKGDTNRLLQVMNNLMSNAAKFEPKGGEVEIKADVFVNTVRFTVKDHGPGIPKSFHSQLFEKFTQADNSSSRSIPGTGLGLAIAKAIVEKHQGYIGVNTKPDVGAEFFFELPLHKKPYSKPSEI